MTEKYQLLLTIIKPYGKVVVAFSGGVDSTFLAYAAAETLGRENVLCVTARSVLFPERELKEAEDFCKDHCIRLEFIDFDVFSVDGFADNPPNRCYLCKFELFSKICALASAAGTEAVFDGSNADDEGDYRPGMQAIAELGVKSPLHEARLSKNDIRLISRDLGLKTWAKPSFACLASRFVYGEGITSKGLDMVSKAEQYLLENGFQTVRVRIQSQNPYTARIEVQADKITMLTEAPLCKKIIDYFKTIGFAYVTLDLEGYRTGSMNEGLKEYDEHKG